MTEDTESIRDIKHIHEHITRTLTLVTRSGIRTDISLINAQGYLVSPCDLLIIEGLFWEMRIAGNRTISRVAGFTAASHPAFGKTKGREREKKNHVIAVMSHSHYFLPGASCGITCIGTSTESHKKERVLAARSSRISHDLQNAATADASMGCWEVSGFHPSPAICVSVWAAYIMHIWAYRT